MKCFWIIENFVKEPSYKGLIDAAQALGYPLLSITGDYKKEMLRAVTSKCVILNGSIKMVKLVKEALDDDCYPIIYCTFEKYLCTAYYPHFGPYLFNDKYCLMPLKELIRQKYDVWGHYGKDALIFVRPNSGEKLFQAGLVDIIDADRLLEANKDIETELVLVSSPKNILWEGRFLVSKEREIIAYSTYRFQGNVSIIPSVPPETLKFCKRLLNTIKYYPDSVFCFDICQDSDGEPYLLELTSFSSAGLYAMDYKAVVQKVSEIAEREYSLHLA